MNRGINWPNWVSICKSKKVTFFTVEKKFNNLISRNQ